ncbi:MAG TPA: hypothetical protein VHC48_04925 [Puia sp.]|nr:hypothetical protein [Puia sp.]
MTKALIKLAYRQIIDASSVTPFEKEVFNATFAEFVLQQQSFSKGLELFTWSAIREKFPKAHPALPFKVSFAIAGLLPSLDKKIPGLEDTLGLRQVNFTSHYFQLLASDINDPSVHRVAIIYFTDTLTYFGNVGDALLLADGNAHQAAEDQPVQTFQLKIDPHLSIISYVELSCPTTGISLPKTFALQD